MESVLLFILGVVIVLVGLILSIGLHEIGHLLPAKLFGVKVTKYMIGFGPTLWSRRKGETEYGVKAFPLGGYISMIGMYPPARDQDTDKKRTGFFTKMIDDARATSAESVGKKDKKRTFYTLPVWKRIIIMFGGPFMNLVLAVVLFTIVLVGFGTAKPSTTIGAVSECLLPPTSTTQVCSSGDPRSPAAEAGLLAGDKIVSYGGHPITSYEQVQSLIEQSAGQKTTIVVERSDGKRYSLRVTPASTQKPVLGPPDAQHPNGAPVTDPNGTVETQTVGMIGFRPGLHLVPESITTVLPAVGDNIANVAGLIVNLPGRLVAVVNAAFGPEERDVNGPISVVGVGRVAGEIASLDQIPLEGKAASLIGILGSLNVALFVFNLIPLMPLDGGHIFGALWEGIRRLFARIRKRPDPGPVDTARLIPLTFVVVIVLGAMSALLVYADIVKPISLFG